jgi:hypothetical protein
MTCLASVASGQARNRIVAQADSAFEAGNLKLADSLYYIAVRIRPRDPEARMALGRYLGAQGRAKVAVVLLEEARMFGGSPLETGRYLAPLYEDLGEWRALLTLPGSPLSVAERRRAAWLMENPFGFVGDNTSASTVGVPAGDTIARVAVRMGGKPVIAALLGTDDGFTVGTRIAENVARRFEGDPTIVTFDSASVAQLRLRNVPATIGPDAATVTLGATGLGRVIFVIDYATRRIMITKLDGERAELRHPMVRWNGELRVLERDHWVSLPAFAARMAASKKTLVVDVAAGEVRVRP